MAGMLLILLSLIAPLQSEYADGWEWSKSVVELRCDKGYLSITDAKYYAPGNFFCTVLWAAASITKTKCNNKASCSISTKPGVFYGEPCWGSQKKVEVWYECKTCTGGQYFTGSGCAKCPQGSYSDAEAKKWRDDLRCGANFPLSDGTPAQCNPEDPRGLFCCSDSGWCGSTKDHCSCAKCTDYSRDHTCTQCPDGQSVRAGEGTTIEDCGTVPWSYHAGKVLSGYSPGAVYKTTSQEKAKAECLKRATGCAGITFYSGEYSLRKGPSLKTSSVDNSFMPLKNNGALCICAHINSDDWTATDIKYDVKNGKVTPLRPSAVGIKTLTNRGSETQSMTLSVSEEVSETMSFSHSAGVSVTVGATFSIGVPLVAEAKISTEVSASYDFSYGTEKSVTKSMSADFACNGPPQKKTVCKALLIKDKVTVPYTMTWTKNSEPACKCEEKGEFAEVAANRLEMSIDETDLKLKTVRRSKRNEEVKISGGFENYKP